MPVEAMEDSAPFLELAAAAFVDITPAAAYVRSQKQQQKQERKEGKEGKKEEKTKKGEKEEKVKEKGENQQKQKQKQEQEQEQEQTPQKQQQQQLLLQQKHQHRQPLSPILEEIPTNVAPLHSPATTKTPSSDQSPLPSSLSSPAIPILSLPKSILVALPDDRSTPLCALYHSDPHDLFTNIKATLGDTVYPSFKSILFSPRDQLPDPEWLQELGSLLAPRNPLLWDEFLHAIGFFQTDEVDPYSYLLHPYDDDYSDRGSNMSLSRSESLNSEYHDHPSYHSYAHINPILLWKLPRHVRKEIPERYPKFFESVYQFLIQHRLGKEDFDAFQALIVDSDSTWDANLTVGGHVRNKDEEKEKEEKGDLCSDDQWLQKLRGLIGMVPRLWGQLQEIVALELLAQHDKCDDMEVSQNMLKDVAKLGVLRFENNI